MWALMLCCVVMAAGCTLFVLRAWVMTHDRMFKNIAAGIQSVCISLAAVVGGVWTLHTFNTLGAQEQALLQKAKLQGEVEKLNSELAKQAVLDIDIKASQEHIAPRGSGRIVSGFVTVTNRGSRNTLIDWTNLTPLFAFPVSFAAGGGIALDGPPPIATDLVRGNQPQRVLVGQTVHLPFAVKLPWPGLYYLEFQTNISAVEQRGPNSIWVGRTVVSVN